MDKKPVCLLLALLVCLLLATPAFAAFRPGFPDGGGYTSTEVAYTFWTDIPEPPTEPVTDPTEPTTASTAPTAPTANTGPTQPTASTPGGSSTATDPTQPTTAPPPPSPSTGPILVYNKQVDLYPAFESPFLAGSDLYIPIGMSDTADPASGTVIAADRNIKNDNVQVSYKTIIGAAFIDAVTLVSGQRERLPGLPAGMYAKIEFTDAFMPLDRSQISLRLVLSVNGVSYQKTATTVNCYLRNRLENISRNSVYGSILPMQFRISPRYNGDASFDFGAGVEYTSRVSANKRYYLNLDRTPRENFEENYPEAYMEYYDFKGLNDTFAAVGQLQIPVDMAGFREQKATTELYVYEIIGDRLSSLGQDAVSYDYVTGKITIRTMTLGNYVLSSRPLMRSVQGSKQWDILRQGYADEASLTEPTVSVPA